MVVTLSALRAGRALPLWKILVPISFLVWALSMVTDPLEESGKVTNISWPYRGWNQRPSGLWTIAAITYVIACLIERYDETFSVTLSPQANYAD
jgi:hypothetical protein